MNREKLLLYKKRLNACSSFYLLLFIFNTCSIVAQEVNLDWLKASIGSRLDYAYSMNLNTEENIYTPEYFYRITDFNPSKDGISQVYILLS
ncbi:hypothetical protein [Chondrinema litorale]|uniref:hypothetical protein n=1 Tax=Chondrinema litorale TaxID=2994555 RepID=UPI002543025B|nr:hypothetical protein [Chondrinema litorale]UZR98438.1 hypothetical protein OQ292_31865 [Chondrinema litorale]